MRELLVISSYPVFGKTHSSKTVGVASYTKSLLLGLKELHPNLAITVLSEKLDSHISYIEDGIEVKRIWKRGNLLSILNLFRGLRHAKNTPLLLSFEINMFGQPLHTLGALFGLLGTRLTGQKTYVMMHQVLSDFKHLESNIVKATVLNISKTLLYKLILLGSDTVIVFEEALKTYLGNNEKVVVIPHFVPNGKLIDKQTARKNLGLEKDTFYALYFGFLAPYKGIDKLVNRWPNIKNTQLIVAGGPNPNHINNASYSTFVENVLTTATSKHIVTTGFVKESDMQQYFAASDICLFPYVTFMSSSGPLSFAFLYEKPILLSQELTPYQQTKDFANALLQSGLTIQDLVCNVTEKDITAALTKSKTQTKQLETFSRIMKRERTLSSIAKKYYEEIFA